MRKIDSRYLWPGAILLLLSLMGTPAEAGLITLTFDTVPAADCYDPWVEFDCTLELVETTAEDCGEGSCFWGTDTPGDLWLYPARLDIDFTSLLTLYVNSVEIDINDNCGIGCTKAFLYDGMAVLDTQDNAVYGESTIVLSRNGGMPDHMAVSSCEGAVHEIRIHTEGVPAEPSTWSTVKALY